MLQENLIMGKIHLGSPSNPKAWAKPSCEQCLHEGLRATAELPRTASTAAPWGTHSPEPTACTYIRVSTDKENSENAQCLYVHTLLLYQPVNFLFHQTSAIHPQQKKGKKPILLPAKHLCT